MVGTGDPAPPFELQGASSDGEIKTYSLDELTTDTALILSVYVYDFSPKCTDHLCDISELEWLTFAENVNVVALGADGPYSHIKFAEESGISYPLLSDTDRSVCAEYGVLNAEKDGSKAVPQRSLFLIDPEQRIRYKWIATDNWDDWDNTPLEEIRTRLDTIEV